MFNGKFSPWPKRFVPKSRPSHPQVDREKSKLGKVVFRDGRPYKGNPVFAYRIQSHFDRQRQYNAATGEQSNVLVEDTQDRPWYEREFMRVNWARNEVSNARSDCTGTNINPNLSCLRGTGLYLRYITEQDQNQQDQAMVMTRDASDKLTYFDWTTQAGHRPADHLLRRLRQPADVHVQPDRRLRERRRARAHLGDEGR